MSNKYILKEKILEYLNIPVSQVLLAKWKVESFENVKMRKFAL